MLLVNGARGIGTGYSTYIPPCNPKTLKNMLVKWLGGDDNALDTHIPIYFEGFKGLIAGGDAAIGNFEKIKDDEYRITELPPGTWTADYRDWLEKELAEGKIRDFIDTSTDKDVHIVVKGIDNGSLQRSLVFRAKTTNMHAFNHKGVITKYNTLNDILKEYAEVRLALYEKRRLKQISDLKADLPYHEDVMRFVEDQISDTPTLDFRKKSRTVCEEALVASKYRKVSDTYDYIFRLPVSTFTAEQVDKHSKKLAELRAEIDRLEKLEAADMWLTELSAI